MTTADGTAEAPASRRRDVRELLRDLVKLPGVRGGLVVAADGLIIAADLPTTIAVEPLSALGATLGRELELRGNRLRRGTFLAAQFAGTDGTVFLGGTPIGFVVLVAEASANREAVRYALRTAIETVRRAWAR